jgi:hypothetical protein
MATSSTALERPLAPVGRLGMPMSVLTPKSPQTAIPSVAVPGSLDRQSLATAASLLKQARPNSPLRSVATIGVEHGAIQFPLQTFAQVGYVLPLGSAFRTAQGQNFSMPLQFTLVGPATTLYLTYSGLPAGVSPLTTSVAYSDNSTGRIFLKFSVSREAPLVTDKPFVIQYSGFAGAVKAEIPLTLSIWTGFDMQHQLESEWCWAATATSIDRFYNPSSSITQCQVVNHQLNRTDACANGYTPECNQPGYLDEALGFLDCLDHVENSPVTYATVVAQASLSRPLGIRVAWAGGGSHFLAATSYEQNHMLVTDDPVYGTSVVDYRTLLHGYEGSGTWTNTYFTRP